MSFMSLLGFGGGGVGVGFLFVWGLIFFFKFYTFEMGYTAN